MAYVAKYSYTLSYSEAKKVVNGNEIFTPEGFKNVNDNDNLVLFKEPFSGKFMVEDFKDFEKIGPNKRRPLGKRYESFDKMYNEIVRPGNWLLLYEGKNN